MRMPTETRFHLWMTALVVASLLADQELPKLLPQWGMPRVGLVTFTLGLAWVALFTVHRLRLLQGRLDVLRDELERVHQRTALLENEARARRGLPRPS